MNELDVQNEWEENTHTHQYSHRLQFKITETSATSFCTHDFDHRYMVDFDLHRTGDSTYTQNTLQHTTSNVVIRVSWRCASLPTGATDEPIWFGAISRYQPSKLSWRRRQHDAFRSKVFWFYIRFPPHLSFPENLCCSRSAVVRHGHPVNHKMCLGPRRGASRVMTKCNGIIFKNNFQ